MNYIWHEVATHLTARIAITPATARAALKVSATLERRQRRRTARYFFGRAVVASVGAALVLSASQADATDVTFGGNNVGYNITGATVVLTAATIQNLSTNATSGSLRMELWALAAPYSGGAFTGYKLAEYQLAQLLPDVEYTGVSSGTIAFSQPPDGTWYYVIFLTEYTAASSDDGYVVDDWANFPNPVVIGPPPPPQPAHVTFGGNNVGYNITGATVVLTAATIQNLSTNATSGSLRMELWALAAPYSGGAFTGYKLAEYQLAQLLPDVEYTGVSSGTIAFSQPPDGTWYYVIFLTEYTAASSDDGYVVDDWANFPNPVVIGPPPPPSQPSVAVEYYYAAWNFYFETAFPAEIAALDGGAFGGAWKRTGQTFNVWPQPTATSSPTCRFFSIAFAPKSSHFYTPFPAECQYVETNPADVAAWEFENIAFYIQLADADGLCDGGTIPLYRAYNNGMGGAPNHRYTTSLTILNQMIAQGWTFEGNGNTMIFACVPQ